MLTLVHDNPDFKPWRFRIRKARELTIALRERCIEFAEVGRKMDGKTITDALAEIANETAAALDAGVPDNNLDAMVNYVDAAAAAWADHLKRHIELTESDRIEPVLVMPVACNLADVLFDVLETSKPASIEET